MISRPAINDATAKVPAMFATNTAAHSRSKRPELSRLDEFARGSTAVTVLSVKSWRLPRITITKPTVQQQRLDWAAWRPLHLWRSGLSPPAWRRGPQIARD